ncbi:MAG: hypothetical protein OXH73_21910 [Caldilineaceae bacterium]|nr:hypothetical protein [Caldilineaceae bacterium]
MSVRPPEQDWFEKAEKGLEGKQAFTQLEQAARILSKFGAGVRYPMEDFVDPDEEEAWEAIRLAGEVATFVKSRL